MLNKALELEYAASIQYIAHDQQRAAVDGPMAGQLHLAEQTNNAPFSLKMEKVCKKATS